MPRLSHVQISSTFCRLVECYGSGGGSCGGGGGQNERKLSSTGSDGEGRGCRVFGGAQRPSLTYVHTELCGGLCVREPCGRESWGGRIARGRKTSPSVCPHHAHVSSPPPQNANNRIASDYVQGRAYCMRHFFTRAAKQGRGRHPPEDFSGNIVPRSVLFPSLTRAKRAEHDDSYVHVEMSQASRRSSSTSDSISRERLHAHALRRARHDHEQNNCSRKCVSADDDKRDRKNVRATILGIADDLNTSEEGKREPVLREWVPRGRTATTLKCRFVPAFFRHPQHAAEVGGVCRTDYSSTSPAYARPLPCLVLHCVHNADDNVNLEQLMAIKRERERERDKPPAILYYLPRLSRVPHCCADSAS